MITLPRRVVTALLNLDFTKQVVQFSSDTYDALRAIKTSIADLLADLSTLQAEVDVLQAAPPAHASTHLPSGSDPLATAAAGAIQPDDSAAVGTAESFARSDHRHSIVAATAGTITPGDSAAEGSATSFARSDHKHAIAAFGTTSGTFAQGNDSRLSDDRTASGLRTASTVVSVSAATAPSSGQVLTATGTTAATWQTPTAGAQDKWDPEVPDTGAALYNSTTSDEFGAGSLDAKWTKFDPDGVLTVSMDTTKKMVKFALSSAAGSRYALLYQAVPGSEFAFYSRISVIQTNAATLSWGIFVSESLTSTADIRTVESYDSGGTVGVATSTATAYNAVPGTLTSLNGSGLFPYLRMRCNGTTCASDFSLDGLSWIQLATVTLGFTPVHFGLLGWCSGAGITGTGRFPFMRVYSGAGSSAIDGTAIGKYV